MSRNRSYDYIVVGAGSAGCVLANRLSADPDRSVLLIEAGGKDRNPLFRLPMLMGRLFHSGIYNWRYHTEPVPSLGARSLYWPRGKVLGGSSTINGMIYVRGNRHDYDRWAQMGLAGWSYDEVLPAFRRSEGHVERDGAYHGTGGELTVCRARGSNPLFEAFVAAGREAGHPVNDDFNGAEQEGVGRYDFTIRRGRRCSASAAFLDPVRHRRNLTIATGCPVRRVVMGAGRATGVEVAQGGETQALRAEREVILCAGTVNSPQLLMLSGIGPGDDLRRHGIPVVHELPGVGRNLQDHVDCVLAYACTRPITLYRELRADRLIRAVVEGMLLGRGIATTFPYEAGAFLRSRAEALAPDIQVHFMPALENAANMHVPRPFMKAPLEETHGFSMRVGPLNPESRGWIALRSADPAAAPLIQPNYLQSEADCRTTIAGIRMVRDVVAQPAFDAYRGPELAPGDAVQSDAELTRWLRANAMTTFHPVGTCRMGTGPMAVVDARLAVHGIAGLRVADASVMPLIVSGNTNAPAVMIGERAAAFILGVGDAHAPSEGTRT
ncbi:MAG: choline dehydrogenase [Rhodospirillales bacterium]|nr:choline dehydrogenase [Rhodospirillales bacterium]MDE0381815.1 choline dehydrogenase [Rhodospirillales bacterium]